MEQIVLNTTPEFILKNTFHHENYKSTHQQLGVYAIALGKHKNILINMATKGGKSLCYQIPGNLKF